MKKETVIASAILFVAGVFCGVLAERKAKRNQKTAAETDENPNEEKKKSRRILVVNETTKDISTVVLENGEEIEDKTLIYIDTLLGDLRESNVLRSFKAKRNTVRMKEAKLDVGEITDLWFKVKEQIDTITPDQITEMIREVCDKKTGEQ